MVQVLFVLCLPSPSIVSTMKTMKAARAMKAGRKDKEGMKIMTKKVNEEIATADDKWRVEKAELASRVIEILPNDVIWKLLQFDDED